MLADIDQMPFLGLGLLQKFRDGNKLVTPPLRLRKYFLQHRHRPAPPIMANDDSPGPQHAQNMIRIHPPVRDLRVMRIYPTKDYPVPQPVDETPHAIAEQARSRSEVVIRRIDPFLLVRIPEHLAHFVDLRLELLVT